MTLMTAEKSPALLWTRSLTAWVPLGRRPEMRRFTRAALSERGYSCALRRALVGKTA
jgi:hypothetical protein